MIVRKEQRMTFSNEWEELYKDKKHMSVWPWSDVVSYVMRYVKPQGNGMKVLEVGFGAGANVPFFARLGADVYGIDGSPTIVEAVKQQYPQYAPNLICGDFTKEIPFCEEFDLILDRGSITQNNSASIEVALRLIYDKLKPSGKFIGIDWFSKEHHCFSQTDCVILDDCARTDFRSGYFEKLGVVHFSDKENLEGVLHRAGFKLEKLEHKTYKDYSHGDYDNAAYVCATWNFVAVRK